MRHIVIVAALALSVVNCVRFIPTPTEPSQASPPVINSFTADATRLATSLLDTFLRWDVAGDTSTRCRIDSPGQPSQSLGNVPLGGFVQVRPLVSRDYTLICSNSAGTAMRVLAIIVG